MEPQQPTPPSAPPPSAPVPQPPVTSAPTPPPMAPTPPPAGTTPPYSATPPYGGQPPTTWQAPAYEPGPAPGVRFAGYAARLIAYIVDGFIAGAIGIALFFVLGIVAAAAGSAGNDFLAGASIILALLGFLVVTLLYFPYFWAKSGQTPGMRMMRIKVVRDADGGPISGGTAVLRLFGLWVNGAVFYLGYIWVFVDKRRRGWHDLIAGTVVIEV